MDKSFDFVTLLKNHEKKYRHKPTSIMNVTTGIQKRLEKNIKYRKSSRLSVFDSIRNLQSNEVAVTVPLTEKQKNVDHKRLQLEKWKEEKEKKKKQAAAQKKKPFVIGISHPPLNYVSPPLPLKLMPSKSGRITRSQTRANNQISLNIAKPSKSKTAQSFAPKNAAFKPELKISGNIPSLAPKAASKKINIAFEPVDSKPSQKTTENKKSAACNTKEPSTRGAKQLHKPKGVKKSKSPSLQKLQSRTSQSDEELSHKLRDKNKTPRKSIKGNNKVTPKNKIPKSESSSEERLRSPKFTTESINCNKPSVNNLENLPMTPEQIAVEVKNISPRVTLSRGKDKARKEIMMKMAEGLLDDDNGNTENVQSFRRQLESEVMRITEMCETWEKISQQLPLSESIQELVLAAVGQARLLVSQKLAQFGSLVSACERPEPGAALVTPADLHGFWDMVFMQIENVDMRFKKLEDIRARNWVEEVPVLQKKRTQKLVKNNIKHAATSRLRDLIAAARKAKKEQVPQAAGAEVHKDAVDENKTFDAGFFRVSSPVRSPATPPAPVAVASPTNSGSGRGLLRAVLSSEAKKASANSASLAMMRASIIGRNIETESADGSQHESIAMTPVTVTETPAKSILKSMNKASTKKKSGKKSIKVVLFDNTNTDTQNDEEGSVLIIDEAKNHDVEIERENNKENEKNKVTLRKQNSMEDRSPVLTRSRRKSLGTLLDMSIGTLAEQLEREEKDIEAVRTNQTPRRSRRQSKSAADDLS